MSISRIIYVDFTAHLRDEQLAFLRRKPDHRRRQLEIKLRKNICDVNMAKLNASERFKRDLSNLDLKKFKDLITNFALYISRLQLRKNILIKNYGKLEKFIVDFI